MNIEEIMLSEISQPQKDRNCMTSTYMKFAVKFTEAESKMVFARAWRQWEMGNCCSVWKKFQSCMLKMLERTIVQHYTLYLKQLIG